MLIIFYTRLIYEKILDSLKPLFKLIRLVEIYRASCNFCNDFAVAITTRQCPINPAYPNIYTPIFQHWINETWYFSQWCRIYNFCFAIVFPSGCSKMLCSILLTCKTDSYCIFFSGVAQHCILKVTIRKTPAKNINNCVHVAQTTKTVFQQSKMTYTVVK